MSQEEMALFYETNTIPSIEPLNNQYVLLYLDEKLYDEYKFIDGSYVELEISLLDSPNLGRLRPKDVHQRCLVDALLNDQSGNNNITLIKGHAGTGKSLFSLHYCFHALDRNIVDKIVIITNPMPTKGSWRIGSLPGTMDEKLMPTSIGNMLASKLGDKGHIADLINKRQLEILPSSEIRGYETGKVCLYLTEAQNYDIYLMKLILQRVGDRTKVIIEGDSDTQTDSRDFEGRNNGMRRISEVFRGEKFYSEVELKTIYRSPIAMVADQM